MTGNNWTEKKSPQPAETKTTKNEQEKDPSMQLLQEYLFSGQIDKDTISSMGKNAVERWDAKQIEQELANEETQLRQNNPEAYKLYHKIKAKQSIWWENTPADKLSKSIKLLKWINWFKDDMSLATHFKQFEWAFPSIAEYNMSEDINEIWFDHLSFDVYSKLMKETYFANNLSDNDLMVIALEGKLPDNLRQQLLDTIDNKEKSNDNLNSSTPNSSDIYDKTKVLVKYIISETVKTGKSPLDPHTFNRISFPQLNRSNPAKLKKIVQEVWMKD